jgi:hypothetical protein
MIAVLHEMTLFNENDQIHWLFLKQNYLNYLSKIKCEWLKTPQWAVCCVCSSRLHDSDKTLYSTVHLVTMTLQMTLVVTQLIKPMIWHCVSHFTNIWKKLYEWFIRTGLGLADESSCASSTALSYLTVICSYMHNMSKLLNRSRGLIICHKMSGIFRNETMSKKH